MLKCALHPKIAKNSLKTSFWGVQGRSRSSMLINPKSLSPVLVTISSMYVPICNRFHATRDNCGVPVYVPAVKLVPNAWWQRHICVNTCLRSLPGSVLVLSRTCAPEWHQDYKSGTLPLDCQATRSPYTEIIYLSKDSHPSKWLTTRPEVKPLKSNALKLCHQVTKSGTSFTTFNA